MRRGLLPCGFDADTVELARELGVVCCNPSADRRARRPRDDGRAGRGRRRGDAVDRERPRPVAGLVDAGVAGLITDHAGELTGWSTHAR